jgi:hypothetical protein
MVTGALFLMLVLLVLLLAAFIYQIVTTPLTAVDAPTLVRSAAASSAAVSSAAAPVLPARLRRASPATGPAHGASQPGASRKLQSWLATALTVGGLAAVVIGGVLFLHIAHGAAVCSAHAIQVCSQGFVLLTGAQLAGGAIATVGIIALVIAIVLALR